MKKKLLILGSLLLITGCNLAIFNQNISPTRSVENFLGKYQSLDNEIITQLDNITVGQNLTAQQGTNYKNLMRKQYEGLTYTIKEESVDGDTAIVTVEIEVYDLTKSRINIDDHILDNEEDFLDKEGNFSEEKYMDYRIDNLMKENKRTKYTIDFRLTKENREWRLDELTKTEKEKIHGIYVTS